MTPGLAQLVRAWWNNTELVGLIPVRAIPLRVGLDDLSGSLPPQTILWNTWAYLCLYENMKKNYFSKTFLSSWFCLIFPPLFQYFFNIENKIRLREFFAKDPNFTPKACIEGVSKKHNLHDYISALKTWKAVSGSAQQFVPGEPFSSASLSSWALFLVDHMIFFFPISCLGRRVDQM